MKNFLLNFARGFVKNIKTIIQAAVFSVIIWFVISIQIFPNIALHVSGIELVYEPTTLMKEENLQITSVDTESVTIQIQGKRYTISDLTEKDFVARLDLSGIYDSGEYVVNVNVTPADAGTDCEIITKSLTAKIKVVKIVTKEIEVVPDISSVRIADEMQVEGDVTVTPSSVMVTGEERLVNSISRIEAKAVCEDELDQTAEVSASLQFFSSVGAMMVNPAITTDNSSFTVNIPVYKVKTLPVKVKFTNCPINFNIDELKYDMSINELTIASPDSSIDNLNAIDIGEISLSALTLKDLQGGVALPVKLPDGYKNISGNKTITVSFPDSDSYGQLGFTALSENITIINAPVNYEVKVLTNELNVNVVGLSTYIQELTSADIYATVNLLGVELYEGTKTVSVTIRLTGTRVKGWVTGEEYKVELLVTPVSETTTE